MLNKDDKTMRFKEFVWWMIFSVPIAGISKESKSDPPEKGKEERKNEKKIRKKGTIKKNIGGNEIDLCTKCYKRMLDLISY